MVSMEQPLGPALCASTWISRRLATFSMLGCSVCGPAGFSFLGLECPLDALLDTFLQLLDFETGSDRDGIVEDASGVDHGGRRPANDFSGDRT
jgi:hypothetical protein